MSIEKVKTVAKYNFSFIIKPQVIFYLSTDIKEILNNLKFVKKLQAIFSQKIVEIFLNE